MDGLKLTPDDLARAISRGWHPIPEMLSKSRVARLQPEKTRVNRLWVPVEKGDPSRDKTLFRVWDARIAKRISTEVHALLVETREAVRTAARTIDEPSLVNWGEEGQLFYRDLQTKALRFHQFGARYYRMYAGYGIPAHRDPETNVRAHVNVVTSGWRDYMFGKMMSMAVLFRKPWMSFVYIRVVE